MGNRGVDQSRHHELYRGAEVAVVIEGEPAVPAEVAADEELARQVAAAAVAEQIDYLDFAIPAELAVQLARLDEPPLEVEL